MDFTLSQEEYESLVALAREGALGPDKKRYLDAWLKRIEERNDVQRHELWIQWQEADQALPPNIAFPAEWPPTLRFHLEFISRPIGKEDVEAVLRARARRPVSVLVTPDPGAELGWTKIEDFFVR